MKGEEVTEMVIFICIMVLWAAYLLMYFSANSFGRLLPCGRKHMVVNLWSTAMRTRDVWARDLMSKADDARGAALLAVQQMRNIIVSCTLLVMGMAQIMGRLVEMMVNDQYLDTINRLVRKDPITGPGEGWPPPEVRVAVPFGATLVSLLCFGQAVRLAVHIGFDVRVQGITGGATGQNGEHEDGMLLDDEVVVMLQRAELYFTLGLRFLYLFIGTIFWVLGITPLLVSSLFVLILLIVSDILVVPDRKGHTRVTRKDDPAPAPTHAAHAPHPVSL